MTPCAASRFTCMLTHEGFVAAVAWHTGDDMHAWNFMTGLQCTVSLHPGKAREKVRYLNDTFWYTTAAAYIHREALQLFDESDLTGFLMTSLRPKGAWARLRPLCATALWYQSSVDSAPTVNSSQCS